MTPHRVISWCVLGFNVAVAVIGWVKRSGFDPVRKWALAWVGFTAISSVVEQYCRLVIQNTQYSATIWFHVSGTLAICVLAAAVHNASWRRRYFVAAAIFPIVLLMVTLRYETWGGFARYIGVIHGVTVLLVGSGILLVRASVSRVDLMRDPGFWIGVAFVLQGAPTTFGTVSVTVFGNGPGSFVGLLYTLRNVVAFVGFAFFLRAFLLSPMRPRDPTPRTPR